MSTNTLTVQLPAGSPSVTVSWAAPSSTLGGLAMSWPQVISATTTWSAATPESGQLSIIANGAELATVNGLPALLTISGAVTVTPAFAAGDDELHALVAALPSRYATLLKTKIARTLAHAPGPEGAYPATGTAPTFATSGPGGNSPVASRVTLPYNTPLVTYRAGTPQLINALGTNYQRFYDANSVVWGDFPWWIEFDYYGSDFDVPFRNNVGNGSYFWVWADGIPLTSAPQVSSANSANSKFYYRVTFGSTAQRRLRILLNRSDFGGLDIGPTDTVSPVDAPPLKITIEGDSWVEGAAGVANESQWGSLLGEMLKASVTKMGQGGTGYTANGGGGTKSIYGDANRVAFMALTQPDILIVFGSINDDANNATVGAAATAYYSAVATALPNTRIIVIGPPPTSGSPSANRIASAAAVVGAANAAPNVIGVIDGVTDAWFSGTGRVGATTGSGNSDLFIASDGAHPTVAGHAYIARRIYSQVVSKLTTYTASSTV